MISVKRLRTLLQPKNLIRRSIETRYALAEACLIGVVSALAALLLKEGIGWLGVIRLQVANTFGAGFALPVAGLILGFLAGWLLENLSPASAGGGIPQVKAVLADFPMPLSLRVAVVKLIGTILVLGAGLTLGRRGPTVHIGAALASQLSQWLPTSPEHRRQMIAAGAAAGLAAGFNTPIAGVLFVIEELMRDASNLTLETAILASFTGAVVSRLLGSADLNIPARLLDPSLQTSFSVSEIPTFLLLGALAGLLGGLFNRGILFSLSLNNRLQWPMSWRIGLAGLLSGSIVAFLPPFFRDNAGLREFLITGAVGWQNIAIAFVAHFFLTLLAYGSGAPGGLFAPALVLGSALGYLVGIAQLWLFEMGSPYTFALAGMGAFFTGVVRVPVTAIVIVFEITADFDLVLPLMITCAIAYLVGETIYKGSIYQHLLAVNNINLLEETSDSRFLAGITAADVMQRRVETLPSQLSLDEARQAFSRSHYRGFPVVEQGKLVGILTLADLAKLASRPSEMKISEIMTPKPVTVNPKDSLTDVLYLLDRYQLSHLPVLGNGRLVGIITRADIIRVEADLLSGKPPQSGSRPESSYVVYSTRAPATGKGRLLLPLANPQTAPILIEMAAAIAHAYQYELECVQVITIPRHISPNKAKVKTVKSRRLLRQAEQLGKKWDLCVHTQIRVAHDPAQAILETITEQHIDLILMGWKGRASTPGRIFGDIVDTLIRQAPCDVVLVKLGEQNALNNPILRRNWLIPIGGGPNVKRALELLPALSQYRQGLLPPHIWLCQVYPESETQPDSQHLHQATEKLKEKFSLPVTPVSLRGKSVSETLIQFAKTENCNVVMLGASREGLLQQVIQGNIPESIVRGVGSTVILVRSAQD